MKKKRKEFFLKLFSFVRWLAATQFAATNARHAYPCFDEPHIKAEYEIYITHDGSYSALSNYPLNGIIQKYSLSPKTSDETYCKIEYVT